MNLLKKLGQSLAVPEHFWDPYKAKVISGVGILDPLPHSPPPHIEIRISECQYAVDSSTSCHFFKLPPELQSQMLGYLLPDDDFIDFPHPHQNSEGQSVCYVGASFRKDGAECLRSVSALNRQLYHEASQITYGRTFSPISTLNGVRFFMNGHPDARDDHCNFPFHKARHVEVDIMPITWRTHGSTLLRNTIWLCQALDAALGIQSLQIHIFDIIDRFHHPRSPYGPVGCTQRHSRSWERRPPARNNSRTILAIDGTVFLTTSKWSYHLLDFSETSKIAQLLYQIACDMMRASKKL